MNRVTFGVAASPYLAVRTLQQTARDHATTPKASYHITHSFYVDDLLGGASSEEEAKALRLSLCETLAKGGFRLCKFRSSNQSVLSSIEPHLREKLPIKGLTEYNALPYPKALGLEWNSVTDCMSTALNLTQTVTPTKRGLISDIARTFDVLGWIAPSVVLMKILYQKLWLEKVDWDEAVPPDLQAEHALWKQQLHTLNSRQVPRCYYRTDATPITIELHGFSDASERAYSAVVYARSTYVEHPPLVTLVSAKTKVAPLKTLSIPRLELCGADLLSKLLNNIRHALDLPVECLTRSNVTNLTLYTYLFIEIYLNVCYTCMPFIYVDMHLKTILAVTLFSIILSRGSCVRRGSLLQDCLPAKFHDVKFKDPKFMKFS